MKCEELSFFTENAEIINSRFPPPTAHISSTSEILMSLLAPSKNVEAHRILTGRESKEWTQ